MKYPYHVQALIDKEKPESVSVEGDGDNKGYRLNFTDGRNPIGIMEKIHSLDLVYGELYALWRDGIYLGRAYWTKDEIHGDCFLVDVEKDGMKMKQVFIADSWVKANLG